MFHSIRTGSTLCALALCSGIHVTAAADPLLVITKGISAQHTPTGTYVHGVDIDIGQATQGVLISDQEWNSFLSFNHDFSQAATIGIMQRASAAPDTDPGNPYPLILDLAPLQANTPLYSPDEDVIANFWGRDPELNQDLLCTVYQSSGQNRLTYDVNGKTISVPLSGIPLFALPAKDGTSAAIILRALDQAHYTVQLCELGGRRRIGKAIPLTVEHPGFGTRAHAALISNTGRYLYVAFSGYVLGEPDGKRNSWIQAIDLTDSTPMPEPITIEGTLVGSNTALVAGADDSCWVLSHTTGRSHAFAANIEVDDNALRSAAAFTYSGVNSPLQVSVNPDTLHTAIGIGQKIELYDENHAPYKTLSFEDTVTALYWIDDRLILGIANKLQSVSSDTGSTENTISLPTGIITHIQRHPGVKQGQHIVNTMSAPRQMRSIVFSEDRIGIERFAIGIPDTQIDALRADTPYLPTWLRLRTSPGTDAGITISVNPENFMQYSNSKHTIMLQIGTSNTLFQIKINPVDTLSSSILWVRNPEDHPLSVLSENPLNPFARIAAHLLAHPLSYTVQEIAGPTDIDIDRFTTLVLPSASAEYGIFTNQTLLDYLSRGGTILYLAHTPSFPDNNSSGRWLEALGMQLDANSELNGQYITDTKEGFMRHRKIVQFRSGTVIKAADTNGNLAFESTNGLSAVAATRSYGLGSVIAFASSTPFENEALTDPRNLRFVESIFRHFADTSAHRPDLDGDGIPDNIEDENRNQKYDPGETHFALADTDGDGILDGFEDHNQNGIVDDIETNPLLSDTDDDGIADAADKHPLPPSGTPYLAAIDPAFMPAEGSRNILIHGRNLTPNSQIWFGDQISPDIRLLSRRQLYAVVPPKAASSSDRISIEVRDSDFDVPSTLDEAFTYRPRTNVKMTLKAINQVRVQYGIYQLFLSASLDDTLVHIDQASVIVEVTPPEAIEYLGIVPGEAVSNSRQKMRLLVLEKGRIRVTLDEPNHFKRGSPLFQIQCRVNMLTKPSTQFHLYIVDKQLRTPYQGSVDSLDPTEIHYDFKSNAQIPMFTE